MSSINKLALTLATFVVMLMVAAAPSYAGSIQLTSAAQLTPGGTTFVYPEAREFTFTSPYIRPAGTNILTISTNGTGFTRFDRSDGTRLLFNGLPPFVPGAGSFNDISFANPVTEIGLNARANLSTTSSTFTIQAFNGATLIGTYNITNPPGNFFTTAGPFLGVQATGGDVITRLRISLDDGRNNFGFEMDPITFSNAVGPTPVPEPATMLLFSTGLAGIAAKVSKRRQGEKSTEA